MSKQFLHVLPLAEAEKKGINLTNNQLQFDLYKAIQNQSSKKKASTHLLFTVGQDFAGSQNVSINESLRALLQLVKHNLVCQFFGYQHDVENNRLKLLRMFISHPVEVWEKPVELYEASIARTVESIVAYLREREKALDQHLKADLAKDAESAEVSEYDTLEGFLEQVDSSSFEILPGEEMLDQVKSDITQQLKSHENIIYFPGYGFASLSETNLLSTYDALVAFFDDKLFSIYAKDPVLTKELETIKTEEALYRREKYHAETTQFTQRKIAFFDDRQKQPFFAGRFTTTLLKNILGTVEKHYQQLWEDTKISMITEFRQKLDSEGLGWADTVIEVGHKEKEALPKDVWQQMTRDENALYLRWQLARGTGYFFIKRDQQVLQRLLQQMASAYNKESWRVILLREFIEKAEQYFPDFFADRALLKAYGVILRKAYIQYMPWYHKVFMMLGLPFFKQGAFKTAKDRIFEEQNNLLQANRRKYEKWQKQQEQEVAQHYARLHRLKSSNAVMKELYHYYGGNELMFPTVNDIKKKLPSIKFSEFEQILLQNNFQTVQLNSNDDKGQFILLPPADENWRRTARQLLEKIAKQIDPASTDTLTQAKLLKIRTFLQRKQDMKAKSSADTSAYEKLQAEISKEKASQNSGKDYYVSIFD